MQANNSADADEPPMNGDMEAGDGGALAESPMTRESIKQEEKEEEESDHRLQAERYIAFTDAVIAIAMTLLILPLMESADEAEETAKTADRWYKEKAFGIAAFFISFVIVSAFWREHNALFSRLEHMTPLLVKLNVLWMMAITFIPVSTSLIYHLPGPDDDDSEGGKEEEEEEGDDTGANRLVYFQYCANILIVHLLYFCMVLEAKFHSKLWKHHRGPERRLLVQSILQILLWALICGLSQTKMETYAIFIIMIEIPIMWLLERKVPYLKGRLGDPLQLHQA